MRFVCLLLAVVSAVLSISYSGAMPVIFGGGSESGAIDTGVLCAIIAAFLAIVAVLLLLRKKKLAALPLLIAAGVQTYANLSVETPYPYLLVTVALYAVAGLCSLRVGTKTDEAPKVESSDSEIETETFDDATEAAPVVPEKKPRKKWRCPCGGPCLLLGIILALAAAGVSLYFSGVSQQISEGGIKLTSLKDFSALDPLTKRVIAAAAFALLATLFHLGRRTFSAILFFISAGILASLQYGLKIEYPHWDAGVILYLLAALRAEYVGIAAMKNVPPRRYTWAYVYGLLFAIAASLIALSQSGFCPCECASGGFCAFVDTFVALDCKTQVTLLISALGLLGGLMTFLMVPYASWVLVGTMFLTIAAEAVCAPVFAYSWLTVLLLALAGLCSASSVAIDAPLPVKRLSIAAAIFLMLLAALVGSALTVYATKGSVAKKVPAIEAEVTQQELDAETSATEKIAEPEDKSEPVTTESGEGAAEPENEPAATENDEKIAELENQIVSLMAENEAKIAELEAQVTALTNDSDDQVKYLASQAAAKDEEIASLNAAAAENVAKIAELEAQLQAQSSENDAKVAELQAQLQAQSSESDAKIAELEGKLQSQAAEGEKAALTVDASAKDDEIATLNAAADESAAKIVELEAQIQSLTADRDEQVKNLTVQTVKKDEEIANLNAAADESAEKISALQKQLDEKSKEAGSTIRYIFVHGRSNVRNVPHANAGSKIISRLMNEVAEVFEVVHPEESTGYWYRVEGSFGTGWVFGNANVFPFEVKK